MRPRLPTRRILLITPFRPPNSPRPFTQNRLLPLSRPQLPFLSSSSTRRPAARFLTTDRKQWIKSEIWKAGKYTALIWSFTVLGLVMFFGVQQEWLDRKFPTPNEWSWVTRKDFRSARWNEDGGDEEDQALVDWASSAQTYRRLLARLENPNIDGAGIEEQTEGGILVAGIGKTGMDLTKKPEAWRIGYYEVLMGAARAAEHLDGWVVDKIRRIAFPPSVVIGPSNPNPRPVPPGAASPPREEDCEPAFEPPEVYYIRALTTHGFTEKQKLDAALAYAAWLDYKKSPDTALEMYKWALDIATADSPKGLIDTTTGVLNTNAGNPSANILSASSALAIHHAVNSNLDAALPIFLSILRARRSLPKPPVTMHSTLASDEAGDGITQTVSRFLKSVMISPKYPGPPPDGRSPPDRDAEEKCEEAGIMTYIGEILYASTTSRTSREDGLAWTREAVDIAEEELRGKGANKDAKKTCKQCLSVALVNWGIMVSKMAKEEKEIQSKAVKGGSWLGFGGEKEEVVGRWESEEQVVRDRMSRAKEILGAQSSLSLG